MNKEILSLILLITIVPLKTLALSFDEASKKLEAHESVKSIKNLSLSLKERSAKDGSWGDPIFKVSAKNFPKDSLKDNKTPMTGLELGVSQKISLTTKYGNIESAGIANSKAKSYEAKDKKRLLTKNLWEIIIIRRKILEEVQILNENFQWITKILKISKKLYANGRTSQQALLDIQIRKSELEGSISNKKFNLSQLDDKLEYLIDGKLNYKTVPWDLLKTTKSNPTDFKELALNEELASKDYMLKASRLNYIPDLTVSFGYTKRSNIDNNGDFIGASIAFPLPFSGKKYAKNNQAINEKYSILKQVENYKRSKKRDIQLTNKDIQKLQAEISILNGKTIKFAQNSRKITSKSYGLGNSTYLELLQSELKLQSILLKKVTLVAKRDIKKVTLKYILGESLHE